MSEVLKQPFLWLGLTFLAFLISIKICKKITFVSVPPLVPSALIIVVLLLLTGTSFETYNMGGGFLTTLIMPATVALSVPIYRKITLLKKHFLPIFMGTFVGSLVAVLSVIGFSKLFGLDAQIISSLVPKSVTTPIGMEISQFLGGIPSITVIAIMITGIFGAALVPYLCKLFKIDDDIAVGVAMGTSAHAIGTSRAMELNETKGAFSGLSIGFAGLITTIIVFIFL